MANKSWCLAKSHPTVQQIAQKYNISADDARVVLTNARKNNVALQIDDVTLEMAESDEYFQQELNKFKNESASIDAEIQQIKRNAIVNGTFMKAPNGKPTNLSEKQWLQVRTKEFKNWFGDWENDPKNASKVVDENGEPLVVYHGTNVQFDTFDKKKIGTRNRFGNSANAFFFTSKKENAEKIARSTRAGEIYINGMPLYLSNYPWLNSEYVSEKVGYRVSDRWEEMRNGAADLYDLKTIKDYFDAIGESPEIKKTTESSSGVMPVFLNIRDLTSKDYEGKNLMDTHSEEFDKLINDSKDGGVLLNIKDGRMDLANTYYVKEPNQIKSATYNNGRFSRSDENIYHEPGQFARGWDLDKRILALEEKKEPVTAIDLANILKQNPDYAKIIDILQDRMKKTKEYLLPKELKVVISPVSDNRFKGRRAFYDHEAKVIHISAMGRYAEGKSDSVLMHELMHAVTLDRIIGNKKFRAEFEDIFDQYAAMHSVEARRYEKRTNPHYLEEFIADIWSSPDLIAELKNTPSTKKNLSLWEQIKEFFVGLFAGAENTLFADASDALRRLLEEPARYTEAWNPIFFEGQQQMPKDISDALNDKGYLLRKHDINIKDSVREQLREDWGQEYSPEDVERMLSLRDEMAGSIRTSQLSSQKISRILSAFKDKRRFQYLGDFVCRNLSEKITTYLNSPVARDKFGIKESDTRKDVFANTKAINHIYNTIRSNFLALAQQHRQHGNETLAVELETVANNLTAVLYMFGQNLFRDEGVQINPNETVEITSYDNSSPERNDNDDEGQDDPSEKSTNMFSSSDQHESVTSKIDSSVKALLGNIHEKNAKGEDTTDPYGYGLPVYISVPGAISNLLTICKGCETFDEMKAKLEKNKKSIHWMEQLLNALDPQVATDENGKVSGRNTASQSKKEQMRTLFFKSMRKQYTEMRETYASRDEEGNLVVTNKDCNVKHTEEALFNGARRKFQSKTGLPIFEKGKIDFDAIKQLRTKLIKAKQELSAITQMISSEIAAGEETGQKSSFAEANKNMTEVLNKIHSVLKDMGINISKLSFVQAMSNSGSEGGSSKFNSHDEKYRDLVLETQIDRIEELYKRFINVFDSFGRWNAAMKTRKTTDTPRTNPFIRRKGNSDYEDIRAIPNWYERTIEVLAEFSPDSFEASAFINGKRYYPWNNPSTVGTIVEKLTSGDKEKIQKFLREKYGKDAFWFMHPETGEFYSEWLNDFFRDPENIILRYSEKPSFCGKEYGKQSDVEYALSILADFFQPIRKGKDMAWYRMLITSDKPRYSSLLYKRLHDKGVGFVMNDSGVFVGQDGSSKVGLNKKDFRNEIAEQAISFFAQELRRANSVIRFAASGSNDPKFKDYDPKLNTAEEKAVIEKVKKGEKVTVSDVLKNGRYIFRNTGAAFFMNKFILNEIENETELGKFVVDRIFNQPDFVDEDFITTDSLDLFRKGFHQYMQDIKLQNLKDLKDSGLFATKKVNPKDEDTKPNLRMSYLLGNLQAWHTEEELSGMYQRDDEELEWAAQFIGIEPSDKVNIRPALCQFLQFVEDMDEFVYNNWMAKSNSSQIFDVDLAFYGNTTNFQKRNAQVISAGYAIDKDATVHGKKVCDGYNRSITLKTNKKEMSNVIDNIRVLLEKQARRISDPKRRKQFEEGARTTLKALSGMDTTDGQAFVGLTALKKRMAGLGYWSRSAQKELDKQGYYKDEQGNIVYIHTDEAVYQRIKRGYKTAADRGALTSDIEHVFAQTQKPFVYAATNVEREGRGTLTVPVQHKNSEFALVFLLGMYSTENPKSQIAAIARFLEETAFTEDKEGGIDHSTTGIDTVNFDSAVKIGESTNKTIDLSGLNGADTYKALKRAVFGRDNIKKEEMTEDQYVNGTVTKYDASDYRLVQEKPEHFKDASQPMGVQLKILAISNIGDDTICELPDGTSITGRELKRRYFTALDRKAKRQEDKFKDDLGLNMPSKSRKHRTSLELKRSMSTDHKFDVDMRQALSITEREGNEEFVIPLDDASNQASIEAMLLSKTRRMFYRQKMLGGIAVQATSWGQAEDLYIRFASSNPEDADGLIPTKQQFAERYRKENPGRNISRSELDKAYTDYCNEWQTGYSHFEAEVPMPDHIRKYLVDGSGNIDSKYLKSDGTWDMDAIKAVVPEELMTGIGYRQPTEAKYSVMVFKIARFAPDGASTMKFPKELVTFTGSDFDIDVDYVELCPPQESGSAIDREIFNLQLAALRSSGSIQETFKPGDFDDLKELSYFIRVLESGKYTIEQLRAMSPDEIKDLCMAEEDMDLMSLSTDILLHKQNSDASEMIAIAATCVTSHAFISLYNEIVDGDPRRDPAKHPENFTRVNIAEGDGSKSCDAFTVINDKPGEDSERRMGTDPEHNQYVFLDMVNDMDGKLISTEISKYVGGSADAAKDAALFRLGIGTQTLPILAAMHRLGVSSDVARLFIAQPVIRKVISTMTTGGYDFQTVSMSKSIDRVAESIVDAEIQNEIKRRADAGEPEMTEDEIAEFANGLIQEASTSVTKELRYSSLLKNIAEPDSQSAGSKLMLLSILETLSKINRPIRNLDSFSRYNSQNAMRGSSFLDRYAKRKKLERLAKNLTKEEDKETIIQLPEDITPDPTFENEGLGKLCAMFPYIGRVIASEEEMLDKVILENMNTYSYGFFEALDRILGDTGIMSEEEIADIAKRVYLGWKNYLLFASPLRIADFSDRETAEFYTKNFGKHWSDEIERLKKSDPKMKEFLDNNSFVQSINEKDSKDGYTSFTILFTKVTSMPEQERGKYKRDWEALLDHPETRQLGIDIAIYFLARQAGFAYDTPTSLMPLRIKEAIPNYIAAHRDANKISWSEDDMFTFLSDFQRHNPEDTKIVPFAYRDPDKVRKITPIPTDDGYLLSFDDRTRTSMDRYLAKDNEGNLRFRLPVINIEGQLFIVDTRVVINKTGEGKDAKYTILGFPVSSLGIPGQMAEYIDFASESSMFEMTEEERKKLLGIEEKEEEKENKKEDNTALPVEDVDEEAQEEPEDDPQWSFDQISDSELLAKGQRAGTYLEGTPYGDRILDQSVDKMLARTRNDLENRPYLESRVFLRRSEKIAKALGLNIASTSRIYDEELGYSYSLNISANSKTRFGTDLHEEAMKTASLISRLLDLREFTPSVTTYTTLEEADTIEFRIPLDRLPASSDMTAIATYSEKYISIDADAKEAVMYIDLDQDGNVGDKIKQINEEMEMVKSTFQLLKDRGFTSAEKMETNFVRIETTDSDNITENIQKLKEEYGSEDGQKSVGQNQKTLRNLNRYRTGKQNGIIDLIQLAERADNGEEVRDEIRKAFGEKKHPLASTQDSYDSAVLSQAVQGELSGDVYNDLANMIVNGRQGMTISEKVDNLIINTANWIRNNKPGIVLEQMLTANLNFSEEAKDDIIKIIKDKLNELDLC